LTLLREGHIFKADAGFIGWRLVSLTPMQRPDPDDPGAPVHRPIAGPAPSADEVRRMLAGVIDPELHVSIVELGMVDDVHVAPDGAVTVKVALTTAGCPLRSQIKSEVESKLRGLPGVRGVDVEYGEMTAEQKSAAMQRARWQAREDATPNEVPASTRVLAVASGKGGVGKSSVTVNLAAALAARGLTVGVLDADIWGFSVPRMLGVEGRLTGAEGKIHPNTVDVPNALDPHGPAGLLKVVSMGFLVDDEGTALMWRGLILTKAVEQFLTDVRWGDMDYLLIDLPPGTGDIQMGLSRMLPQSELLVVTTPAVAAQRVAVRVADMARRSYLKVVGVVENMSAFVAPDGERFAVFGEGGGAALAADIGASLVAQIPLEPAVSAGSDVGRPVALEAPDSPAGAAFHALATQVVEELAPPIEMAGCTARILSLASESAPAQP
jgi:ATP-binding protein involved in chromosome partitioning